MQGRKAGGGGIPGAEVPERKVGSGGIPESEVQELKAGMCMMRMVPSRYHTWANQRTRDPPPVLIHVNDSLVGSGHCPLSD